MGKAVNYFHCKFEASLDICLPDAETLHQKCPGSYKMYLLWLAFEFSLDPWGLASPSAGPLSHPQTNIIWSRGKVDIGLLLKICWHVGWA